MMLYKLVNGTPVAPPKNGVSADGRVISNFSGRVLHDAAFAEANGYRPEEEETVAEMPRALAKQIFAMRQDETPADEVLED